MSGVVLRCPHCGTTKAAPGECEACHEAQVRYQCTNHTPSPWLDGRRCPQCGAGFGDPPPRSPPPAPPRRPVTPAARSPAAPPVASSKPRTPAAGSRGPRLTFEDVLRSRSRARARPVEATSDPVVLMPGFGLGGCLFRLVLFFAFLVITLVGSLVLFGGTLLQMLF